MKPIAKSAGLLAAVLPIFSTTSWAEAPLKKAPAGLEPPVQAQRAGLPAQPPSQPGNLKGMVTSEPASMNGLEFRAMAQSTWPQPAAGEKTKIKLGLKITNVGHSALRFNRFDTINIMLSDAKGRKLTYHWARDATFIPAPVLLAVQRSQTIWYDAELEIRPEGNHLVGSDGAGGQWWYTGLQAGHYSVVFATHCSEREHLKTVIAQHLSGQPDARPFWQGAATTPSVAVEVIAAR